MEFLRIGHRLVVAHELPHFLHHLGVGPAEDAHRLVDQGPPRGALGLGLGAAGTERLKRLFALLRGKIDLADQVGEIPLGLGLHRILFLPGPVSGVGILLLGIEDLRQLVFEAPLGLGGQGDPFGGRLAGSAQVAEAVAAVGQHHFHRGPLLRAEAERLGQPREPCVLGALGGALEAALEVHPGGHRIGIHLHFAAAARLEDQGALLPLRGFAGSRRQGLAGPRLRTGISRRLRRRGRLEKPAGGKAGQGGGGGDEGGSFHHGDRKKAPPDARFVGIRLRGSP